MNMTLNHWDWIVIGFYFVFIVGIGFLFKHVNKNASDYFRGGGNMLWWMAGMSAIAASISTWSFTAASAKVYKSGFLLPFAWIIGTPMTLIILWFMAPRFRQMRVITSIEAVARRFGFGSEQFYVYLVLPMALFWGGVGSSGIAVFFAGALGLGVPETLIGIVMIVTIMSLFGGQWAVTASDFVQGLLMFLTVLVVVYFSLKLPEIGGVMNLTKSLPKHHFDFTKNSSPVIVVMWIIVMQVITLLNTLNLNGEGGKFLTVKDGRQARGMILLRAFLFLVVPVALIMQLPAMCAATVFPDMKAVFPDMKVPEEGAFLAMAFKTLPQGMMGLLICGMFAAAMSSMDTSLNRNAGYFVRNVYIKYINKEASGPRQLLMGKVFTLVFGIIIILIGLSFHNIRKMDMFNVFQVLNSMIWIPSLVPTALGIVYKRTPGWSGWSTVLVGLGAGAVARNVYSQELIQKILGLARALNKSEVADSQFIFISLIVMSVSISWFFFTSLFYEKSKPEYKEQVEKFFIDIKTPIDHAKEDIRDQDAMQYRLVGVMCLIFGVFTLLGLFIPNSIHGKMSFLFIGGVILGLGIFLYVVSVKKFKEHPEAEI